MKNEFKILLPVMYLWGTNTHQYFFKSSYRWSFGAYNVEKNWFREFYIYCLKEVIWENLKKKNLESLSLCFGSLHLKKKSERVKMSLNWEKVGKMKEYQEERVKTKEGKVDMSQLKKCKEYWPSIRGLCSYLTQSR